MAKTFSRNLSERTGSSSPSLASLPPLEAIVFSDAWWIGTQAENREEAQLDFPKELTEGQHTEYDFKGGAEHSPNVKVEDNVSDDGNKDLMRATPVRHSARTAGKRFKYRPKHFIALTRYCHKRSEAAGIKYTHTKYAKQIHIYVYRFTENLSFGDVDVDNEDSVKGAQIPKQNQESCVSEAKSKKQSHSAFAVTTSVEDSHRKWRQR
ncbi:PREDICTED: DNA-binding RHL1 [Prunus dulcis]|uniref:PREDICTED: DNA-binding RHL1 n=1 Tax=Prunus dulcis TaxID=3755 RepID=A0A5E4EC85_PRUDU|nr:hypothetical protein L3X38_015127 [Prunus dulcis]VVA11348.1 PREDICTED: DNA-binding RHL1 [Prunus dulcis]